MSSFYDDASLVVIPSGYKTSKVYAEKPTDGSGDLAFTRTGDTATRVNSAGLIEKVRTNYARQSQSFATAAVWSATNGTLTNNAGTAPDGTNTASKIVATNTDPFCYQSITLTGPVVASCYVKAVGSAIGKSAEIRAGISLTTFTLSGSWQRVSVTHTASGAHNYGLEVPNPGVIGDEVLLWGFQVEGGDVVTDYIPTTTAAVSVGPVANVPRLDYLGSTCPRLLLEPQRTNLATYSEQFNNAAWVKTAGGTGTAPVVTANNATSPDGYQNADTIVFNAGAGTTTSDQSALYQAITTGAGSHTASFYAKTASGTAQLLIRLNSATYEKITITNQWQRFTLTQTLTAGTNYLDIVIRRGINEPLNATATVQLWGAQVEAGAYATSYIPTLASASTRSADACSKTGISSLIGQTEGVFFAEFTIPETQSPSFFSISAVSSVNRIIFGYYDGALRFYTNSSTGSFSSQGIIDASPVVGQVYKIAVAYKNNDFAIYKNGVNTNTLATFTVPASLTDLDNQGSPGTGQFIYAGVKQLILFKTRLSNAELATLTTL